MSKPRFHGLALVCALSLAACSGGGGGGGSPSPTPSPTPPDTTAPDTSLNSTPANPSNQTTASFSATSNESNASFEMRLDGGPFSSVAAIFSISGLADGQHIIEVRARDAANNVDASPASYIWTVDTQAPDTSISGGPSAGSSTTSTSANFTLESPDSEATFEASLDGAAFAAVDNPYLLDGLAPGSHTLQVRAVDDAGNVDATPAAVSWTINAQIAPGARIVFPGPQAMVDWVQVTVRGTTTTSSPVTAVALNTTCVNAGGLPSGNPAVTTATSTDGYLNWTGSVQVLPRDTCTVNVSVTDADGQTSPNAATTVIRNHGHIVSDLRGIAYDLTRGTLVGLDGEQHTLVRFRNIDGWAEAAAGPQVGAGVSVGGFDPQIDPGNDRVLMNASDSILAVDLATGDRSHIVTASVDPTLSIYGSFAYDAATGTIYGLGVPNTVIAIDVGTGTRSILSGSGFGNGPNLDQPFLIRLDPTSGTPRLLLAQEGGIAAVDIASGDRDVLPGSDALPAIRSFAVDAQQDRLVLLVPTTPTELQLATLSLVDGTDALLPGSSIEVGHSSGGGFVALDPLDSRAYVGTMDRARIYRYDFTNSTLLSFYDTRVGTGKGIWSGSNIDLDDTADAGTIYSSTDWPKRGIVKLDLATGTRTVVSMEDDVGGGLGFLMPLSIAVDRRPGATPNQMLVVDEGFPGRLMAVDLGNGTRSVLEDLSLTLPWYLNRPWILDAPRGHFLRGSEDAAAEFILGGLDATTGDATIISAPYRGTGPMFDAVNAVRTQALANDGHRYIVADASGALPVQVFGVDPDTGDRTVISTNANAASGPDMPIIGDLDVDSATGRALIVGDSTLQWVDLTSGQRTDIPGFGAPVVGQFMSVRGRYADGIAYVKALYEGTGIIAVDLTTGERALISR